MKLMGRDEEHAGLVIGNVIYAGNNLNVEDATLNRVLVIQFASEADCRRAINDGSCKFTFLDEWAGAVEQAARLAAEKISTEPVSVWDLPDEIRARLAGPAIPEGYQFEEWADEEDME